MKYLFLYFIVPAVAVFLLQSILCRKLKKGILRHGALILPIISITFGTATLLTQSDGVFGGLGALAAIVWFANACCTALGYGAAWLIFFAAKRKRSRERED